MASVHESYRNEESQRFAAMMASRGTPTAVPASDSSTESNATQVLQLTTALLNNYIQQGVATGINMGLASCGIGTETNTANKANNGNDARTSNQSNRNNRGGRGGRGANTGGGRYKWRQYTKYCFS